MEGVDEIIETLRMNRNLRHVNIDSSDPNRSDCITKLCRINSHISLWNRKFRDTLLLMEKNDHDYIAILLYPQVWSKFSKIQYSLSVLFELVKDCPAVFVHAVDGHRRIHRIHER